MGDTKDLFGQIQAVCAGHSEAAVTQALLRSLLVVIGVAAPSLQRAEAILDALPTDMKPLLRAEWPKYRQHRAKASAASGAGSRH
jgi:hypothetical protein